MNSQDFAKVMSKEFTQATGKKITQEDTKAIFESLEINVGEILSSGESVSLLGLGIFSMKDVASRSARVGRNPATGEAINIPASPAKKVPQFKIKPSFKSEMTY